MDLFRYFHPHFNPRLRNLPLRLIELCELSQAATELKNAVVRAQIRTANAPVGAIQFDHFNDVITALEYVVESLNTLSSAHPGDSVETLQLMLKERENAAGWENWARLLRQRLELVDIPAFTGTDRLLFPVEEDEESIEKPLLRA